ncbi:MAG: Rrf2 family transcriptional regulator [Firmicutes bacterium]|nr:Rrf2 family transcriptional regulator [Bacillota bacterium]MCL5040339.1 Rrf2 family transcriptional regulator [Bacillota bacterium]
MKLSTKGQYAVRAMVRLAGWHRQGPVSLREIAEQENISQQYLEQLFIELRRAKLVTSVRGAAGGYTLSRDPSTISVGDVVRAVEGPLQLVDCLSPGNEECCRLLETCVSRDVWKKLQDAMVEVMDSLTLDRVVGKVHVILS